MRFYLIFLSVPIVFNSDGSVVLKPISDDKRGDVPRCNGNPVPAWQTDTIQPKVQSDNPYASMYISNKEIYDMNDISNYGCCESYFGALITSFNYEYPYKWSHHEKQQPTIQERARNGLNPLLLKLMPNSTPIMVRKNCDTNKNSDRSKTLPHQHQSNRHGLHLKPYEIYTIITTRCRCHPPQLPLYKSNNVQGYIYLNRKESPIIYIGDRNRSTPSPKLRETYYSKRARKIIMKPSNDYNNPTPIRTPGYSNIIHVPASSTTKLNNYGYQTPIINQDYVNNQEPTKKTSEFSNQFTVEQLLPNYELDRDREILYNNNSTEPQIVNTEYSNLDQINKINILENVKQNDQILETSTEYTSSPELPKMYDLYRLIPTQLPAETSYFDHIYEDLTTASHDYSTIKPPEFQILFHKPKTSITPKEKQQRELLVPSDTSYGDNSWENLTKANKYNNSTTPLITTNVHQDDQTPKSRSEYDLNNQDSLIIENSGRLLVKPKQPPTNNYNLDSEVYKKLGVYDMIYKENIIPSYHTVNSKHSNVGQSGKMSILEPDKQDNQSQKLLSDYIYLNSHKSSTIYRDDSDFPMLKQRPTGTGSVDNIFEILTSPTSFTTNTENLNVDHVPLTSNTPKDDQQDMQTSIASHEYDDLNNSEHISIQGDDGNGLTPKQETDVNHYLYQSPDIRDNLKDHNSSPIPVISMTQYTNLNYIPTLTTRKDDEQHSKYLYTHEPQTIQTDYIDGATSNKLPSDTQYFDLAREKTVINDKSSPPSTITSEYANINQIRNISNSHENHKQGDQGPETHLQFDNSDNQESKPILTDEKNRSSKSKDDKQGDGTPESFQDVSSISHKPSTSQVDVSNRTTLPAPRTESPYMDQTPEILITNDNYYTSPVAPTLASEYLNLDPDPDILNIHKHRDDQMPLYDHTNFTTVIATTPTNENNINQSPETTSESEYSYIIVKVRTNSIKGKNSEPIPLNTRTSNTLDANHFINNTGPMLLLESPPIIPSSSKDNSTKSPLIAHNKNPGMLLKKRPETSMPDDELPPIAAQCLCNTIGSTTSNDENKLPTSISKSVICERVCAQVLTKKTPNIRIYQLKN